MKRAVIVAAVVGVLASRPAHADCAAEADRLRAHLTSVEPAVFRWNTTWAVVLGVGAVAQFTVAATKTNPFGTFDANFEEAMYVGGTKAAIGMLARIVTPLRVRLPAPDPDRCAELTALRASVKKLARQERQNFWLTHLGGTAMNLAGGLLLWHRRSFRVGAISVLTSVPVGWAIAYTLPRKTWHLYREESPSWALTASAGDDHATVGIAGTF